MFVMLFVACALIGQDPTKGTDDADVSMHAQWRPVLDRVAAEYNLVREADAVRLELETRAVYTWARPGMHGGTYGNVYVWTNRGNVEAVACFWRSPASDGELSIAHELHSLSPSILKSERKGPHQWTTKAGLQRQLIPAAPVPASNAAGRLQQMRAMSRDFTANSVSSSGDRVELRLLPQPLFRYQSSNADLLDGALFAFVCTVGTDPEIFLQLEARETKDGPQWDYTLARFSHQNLFVSYKENEIWKAVRDVKNPISHNADNTYWLFHEPFDSRLLERRGTE